MKVKVTKCGGGRFWYADHVGEIFEVSETLHAQGYELMGTIGKKWIAVEDAEVVEDEKPKFPFKVRCINNMYAEEQLVEGKVYDVVGDNNWQDARDYWLEGVQSSWGMDRFDVVEEASLAAATLPKEVEYTGGSVSYYSVPVNTPTDPDKAPYIAECNDLVEALGMNYAEGNAFKAIWRSCAARKFGAAKKGYDDGLYDAEKVVFFGQRMVAMAKK